jgi:hypothetical protein
MRRSCSTRRRFGLKSRKESHERLLGLARPGDTRMGSPPHPKKRKYLVLRLCRNGLRTYSVMALSMMTLPW